MGNFGTILKTINGGSTWTPQFSGTNESLNSVFFTDVNTGYVVGSSGTILKTTNGGGYPAGINEMSIQSNMLKIYPNPSFNLVTIETSGATIESSLTILNIEGQQLITRQITESKTQMDISNLPSGVYFVRLINDKTVEVGKIIKQ